MKQKPWFFLSSAGKKEPFDWWQRGGRGTPTRDAQPHSTPKQVHRYPQVRMDYVWFCAVQCLLLTHAYPALVA